MDVSALHGTSKGSRNPVSSAIDTIRQIRRDDSKASETAVKSTITASDNTSVPFILPREEEDALVAQLRAHPSTSKPSKNASKNFSVSEAIKTADDFYLRACLRARKGDVERAHALLSNYVKWRHDTKFEEQISAFTMGKLLRTGIFVVAGNKSKEGRPILMIRYKYFNPKVFAPIDVALALGAVVEYILREYPESQSNGVVVLDDMAGFSVGNFDFRVFKFLEKAMTQVFPMRLAAIHIANPGWIMKTIFGLVSGFMSRKIQARIGMVESGNVKKMYQFFDKPDIPTFLNLGGSLQWGDTQLKDYVDNLEKISKTWLLNSSKVAN